MLLTMALSSAFSLVLGLLGLGPLAMYALIPLGMMGAVVFYAGLYFSFVDCFAFGAPRAADAPQRRRRTRQRVGPGGVGRGIILAPQSRSRPCPPPAGDRA